MTSKVESCLLTVIFIMRIFLKTHKDTWIFFGKTQRTIIHDKHKLGPIQSYSTDISRTFSPFNWCIHSCYDVMTFSFTPQIWMPRAASTRLLKCIGWSLASTSSLMKERRPTSSLWREEGTALCLYIILTKLLQYRDVVALHSQHHKRCSAHYCAWT